MSYLPLRSLRTAFRARGLHTQAKAAPFNIVFDIDGVLIKVRTHVPKKPDLGNLPSSDSDSFHIQHSFPFYPLNNIPYIFLTNGGGVRESEKADQLSKKLGIQVNPDHLIVSHSPMRSLVSQYRNSNVMVVGGAGNACKDVAEYYGFNQVFTPRELHQADPSVCPISMCTEEPSPLGKSVLEKLEKPVEAVMVFHDSEDWGRGALGTIKNSEELHSTKQSVPIYFSNPDVVWSNEYPVPRFGQGSFKMCLEKVYQHLTGQELEYTSFGKPLNTTYKYAEALLDKIAPLQVGPEGRPSKRTVYAVGDNPYADIAGANGYGWNSVLVKTGVYMPKGFENHHVHPASAVVDHVEDAVRWIIAKEQMKQ
ncbi:Haloacid dehalogenase-like hydrolase domain-containing 5 [Mortierella alpina]|nr:Haloacid dehalogenase-like hydrolase domain-containing 5 [Mortierella alpina]